MTSVVGVIPARFSSTRFPGKPLALIRGKPMILWVAEAARRARNLNEVLVATDDTRIQEVVKNAGFKVCMTPSELPSGTDRIFAATQNLKADFVVNIQGDEPLLNPLMLEELVEPLLKDPTLEMSTLSNEINLDELKNPNLVKVICNQKNEAIYFSRFPIPYSRQEATPPLICRKHVGLYAYRREFLKTFCSTSPSPLEMAESLEQLRALALGARIAVVPSQFGSHGVDSPEDLIRIEKLLGEMR